MGELQEKEWVSQQQQVGFFFFPVSATGSLYDVGKLIKVSLCGP